MIVMHHAKPNKLQCQALLIADKVQYVHVHVHVHERVSRARGMREHMYQIAAVNCPMVVNRHSGYIGSVGFLRSSVPCLRMIIISCCTDSNAG